MDFANSVMDYPRHGIIIRSVMAMFLANADYEDQDTNPLRLAAGDLVRTGTRDQTWPGWIWAEDEHGNDGYVPEDILETDTTGISRVLSNFDPHVLRIRRGDRLESLRRVHGWHWCRNEGNEEGWVAGYLLRPAT